MKMYTVSDLCEISGLSRMGIFGRARRLGIKVFDYKFERTSKGNCIKVSLFTSEQAEKMGLFIKKTKMKTDCTVVKIDIEEMKRLHPLVKDVRYFKTSYFPEIIPECYKESK